MIDLGEIERINSCGVRDWVNWLCKLENNGTRSVLVECSPAIVAQINLVNNFTGNGVVKSFYVPYFCPECDEEKVLLVEASDMGPPPHEPPTCRCDECDLVMDFDDMPDSLLRVPLEPEEARRAREDQRRDASDLGRGSEPTPAKGKVKLAREPAEPRRARELEAERAVAAVDPAHEHAARESGKTTSSGPRLPTKARASRRATRCSGASRRRSRTSIRRSRCGWPTRARRELAAPGRSNALVFALIGVLIAAIAVLAYLVLTK